MYKVTREGYRGFVKTADGSDKVTILVPACDKSLLEATLDGMLKNGEITEYEVKWVTVQVNV